MALKQYFNIVLVPLKFIPKRTASFWQTIKIPNRFVLKICTGGFADYTTMENLFSCDGNFSFMQWYQNNVPNRNFLHTGRRGVPLRYCIDGANRVRITGLRE